MPNKLSLTIVLAALCALNPGFANAEAGDPLNDRFSFSLGGFLLNTDTELRVDGESSQGTVINLENDFGFDNIDRFRIDGYWRFTPRQKLRVMYFDTKRTENSTIDREIVFQDETYAIDTDIRTTFKTTVAELAYEFAFLRGENYEVGASIGIHNLKFTLGLDVVGNNVNLSESRTAEANGPLPMVGLSGTWRINDKFYVQALAQFFRINYDPYDGRLSDVGASFVWQATRHVGLGLGYNDFSTHVDVDDDRFRGQLKWSYGGARVFLTASF